jgi:hypothetical protein
LKRILKVTAVILAVIILWGLFWLRCYDRIAAQEYKSYCYYQQEGLLTRTPIVVWESAMLKMVTFDPNPIGDRTAVIFSSGYFVGFYDANGNEIGSQTRRGKLFAAGNYPFDPIKSKVFIVLPKSLKDMNQQEREVAPQNGFGMQEMAEDLIRAYQSTELSKSKKIVLAGISKAGLVFRAAMKLSGEFENKVTHLVAIATPHHGTAYANPLWFRHTFSSSWLGKMFMVIYDNGFVGEAYDLETGYDNYDGVEPEEIAAKELKSKQFLLWLSNESNPSDKKIIAVTCEADGNWGSELVKFRIEEAFCQFSSKYILSNVLSKTGDKVFTRNDGIVHFTSEECSERSFGERVYLKMSHAGNIHGIAELSKLRGYFE